ncbi:sugar phosphate isomerase/epimerase [Mesorhizobium sp. BR1-1-16]|uniref:sugar phosphate isomerase/epimerase family protein n=1 Tax=Mesorhizobium sp. BR1-1-16 TaxID=2876653 RepID=UPI001CCE7C93|nr:TIM barrel protein [Mesorhizobium sp. BR1-1-16]MBZ9939325.1 sugar phosphate isomerase/epimerase [Mesorhizobium sp. BR1-1-16]
MIRLGGYGIPIAADADADPKDIAAAHLAMGYNAAYCPAVALEDSSRISAIRNAFAAADIEIAEVAAWRNISPPEPDARKAARDYVKERLALADEVGARCAITYIGSMAPGSDYEPHPDNLSQKGFDTFVDAAREIIDAVKPKRAKFCLEMMQWELPDSPEILVDLIKAIDRPAFAAHLDPVNLIVSPRQYYDTASLIRRCFELLGPWIISCHAKDITMGSTLSLHFDEVIPGRGALSYPTYLKELDGRGIPIMLEHLADSDYPEARDHLKSVGRSLGITI